MTNVALISMPFGPPDRPSLGLSLLKAALSTRDIPSKILYFNLEYYDHIDFTDLWSSDPYELVGEWIFSGVLFGDSHKNHDRFVNHILKQSPSIGGDKARFLQAAISARKAADQFIEACVTNVQWHEFRIVGFSSIFQQNTASLALAKRLKQDFPHLFVVLGGANCHGDMGRTLIRSFDFIDAVCIGEGDVGFPALVSDIMSGQAASTYPGFVMRSRHGDREELREAAMGIPEAPVSDLDSLPYPDFDDFFEQRKRYQTVGEMPPQLLFESSRGCWWGQKTHCTFCGLNGNTMAFRVKSPKRALGELQYLLGRYGTITRDVSAIDNIMPYAYERSFVPLLKEFEMKPNLFYEVKANLRKGVLQDFRDAGIVDIQPGIESLSTELLRKMRKGVTRLQNIRLLKWCQQYGVRPHWNYLTGFPGERPSHYDDHEDLIKTICHLKPPPGLGRVRIDRFSPYFFQSKLFGITNLRPYEAYDLVYFNLDSDTRYGLAYYFEGDVVRGPDVDIALEKLRIVLDTWNKCYEKSALFSVELNEKTLVFDLREMVEEETWTYQLVGIAKDILKMCDDTCSVERIVEALKLNKSKIEESLETLVNLRLLVVEDGKYLSVVNEWDRYYCLPVLAWEKLDMALGQARRSGSVRDERVVLNARTVN